MAKKNKKTKYNPEKYLRHRAEKLALFRWENGKLNHGEFMATGPGTQGENNALMLWATGRRDVWVGQVVACFMDSEGNYYEESIDLPPFGPVNLTKDAEQFDARVEAAITEAKHAGNPKHYIDTATILRLHSDRAERVMNCDDEIKKQALYRANLFNRMEGHATAAPC